MFNNELTFADPAMKDVGPIIPPRGQPQTRVAQRPDGLKLPAQTIVVSADDHCEISEDIFYENFPAHLKEKAPRVWYDRYWHVGYRGELENYPIGERVESALERAQGLGIGDLDLHLEHMQAEGVSKAIVFPQSLLAFIRYPDLEIQELMYRIYNDYIADLSAKSGGKIHGVGVFSNWWDPAKAEQAMQQIVDLGLKTFMVPVNPGKTITGAKIHYGDPVMERFWSVVADSGLPLNFHVGESLDETEHRGGLGALMMQSFSPFRKPLGQVIFGGVFDRHPNLQVVFSEGQLSWLLDALQTAEMLYDTYGNGDLLDRIEHRPSHYWHNNCYASFQNDLMGLRNIDYIGANRVMWASDYPHPEGTFGFTSNSVQSVLSHVSPENAREILGGTAMKLYKLGQ